MSSAVINKTRFKREQKYVTERIAELREERAVEAGARLVAGEQVVAPRLDDVIGRGADVGDVRLAEEREHRIDQALDRVHRPPVRRAPRWPRVIGPKELEGGVDEVELHAARRG